MGKIAAVLVRSRIGTRADVRKALDSLGLRKRHTCVLLEDTPVNRGMLQKCKDYIAYGPVDESVFVEKKPVKGTVYRLAPPRGGYGGSIKRSRAAGGALGKRDDMTEFVKRMV